MRKTIPVALAALALLAGTALAGVGVGDRPPTMTGKDYFHTSPVSLKDLEGKVVLYEIFRTW